MGFKMPFTDDEKNNMHGMLRKSIEDLHKEKLNGPGKWPEKVKKYDMIVNFQMMGPDFKESAGFVTAKFEPGGKLTVKDGRSDDAVLELKAPLGNFFQFSSNEMSLIAALFGKLKIKGKRHLKTLLNISSMMRVIPESKLEPKP